MAESESSGFQAGKDLKAWLTDTAPELDEATFFSKVLLAEVPEFRPVYEEFMDYWEGELLGTLLMSDLARFTMDAYRKSVSKASDAAQWNDVVTRVLDLMEHAPAVADDRLFNTIGLSFVEDIADHREESEFYEGITSLFGPGLRSLLRNFDPNA